MFGISLEHAARTNAHDCSLETTSQMPSHARMTNSSSPLRGYVTQSGTHDTSCSS